MGRWVRGGAEWHTISYTLDVKIQKYVDRVGIKWLSTFVKNERQNKDTDEDKQKGNWKKTKLKFEWERTYKLIQYSMA